jgi:hypothetical protein
MVRVVFATSALGMGVNLPNIRHIIHYGVPHDVEEYLQNEILPHPMFSLQLFYISSSKQPEK